MNFLQSKHSCTTHALPHTMLFAQTSTITVNNEIKYIIMGSNNNNNIYIYNNNSNIFELYDKYKNIKQNEIFFF